MLSIGNFALHELVFLLVPNFFLADSTAVPLIILLRERLEWIIQLMTRFELNCEHSDTPVTDFTFSGPSKWRNSNLKPSPTINYVWKVNEEYFLVTLNCSGKRRLKCRPEDPSSASLSAMAQSGRRACSSPTRPTVFPENTSPQCKKSFYYMNCQASAYGMILAGTAASITYLLKMMINTYLFSIKALTYYKPDLM